MLANCTRDGEEPSLFGFGSVLFGFYDLKGSVPVLDIFVNRGFGFCSVRSKMRVLVRFGFGSIPISKLRIKADADRSILRSRILLRKTSAIVNASNGSHVALCQHLLSFLLYLHAY